ncbi:MAG: hypothetical protein DRJ01_09395 [Bacteroidetes bacterium]|nr:MAG: hypothetical protein DRJ01_09395 [Bacteroidota bacterium]
MEMLEHQKVIIRNVSSNKELFENEIKKSIKWLNKNDLLQFNKWLIANFNDKYPDIISKYFDKTAA